MNKNHFFYSVIFFLGVLHTSNASLPPHTAVKTHNGAIPVSLLHAHNMVVCPKGFGAQEHVAIKSVVTTTPSYLYTIKCSKGSFEISGDQQVYDPVHKKFVAASALTTNNYLIDENDRVLPCLSVTKKPNTQICYELSLAKPHVFYASDMEILVHNFDVGIGIAIAFGGGEIVIKSITATFALVGLALGITATQSSKRPIDVELSYYADSGTSAPPAPAAPDSEGKTGEQKTEGKECQEGDKENIKAPGRPTENDGFPPKKKKKKTGSKDDRVKHPITGAKGWEDKHGNIWVPTGEGQLAHGGAHWDVQSKDGKSYKNVFPGGHVRPGK